MLQEKIKDILRMPNQKIDPGMMNQGQIEQLLIGLSKVLHFNIDGDMSQKWCNTMLDNFYVFCYFGSYIGIGCNRGWRCIDTHYYIISPFLTL